MVKTLFLQQKEFEGKTKDMRILAVLWMLFYHYQSWLVLFTLTSTLIMRLEVRDRQLRIGLTLLKHTITFLPLQIY